MRAKTVCYLNEMSIENINFQDIINNNLIKSILDEYDDPDENYKKEELEFMLKHDLEENFYEIIYKFENDLIDDNDEISIYRKIAVDDTWLNHLEKQGNRLGIYWSWDMTASETHWGYNQEKRTFTIESSIKSEYVNWIETLRLNIDPSYSEEKEIRLFKNTPLRILNIYDEDNQIIEISQKIKDKIFKA